MTGHAGFEVLDAIHGASMKADLTKSLVLTL